mmetsp:Transcript_61206/g.122697  ORF Transcript_61206/g.122697 Transcript_61206/m.122697 type:complete len:454 (-) Transcript_61206:229-1590(-)
MGVNVLFGFVQVALFCFEGATPFQTRVRPIRPRTTYVVGGTVSDGSDKAVQFQTMMKRVADYPDVVLESIEDTRFRELLRGVKDATATKEVVDAFSVLYEDYRPIRTAGNMIFKMIDTKVSCAADRLKELCVTSNLDEFSAEAARELFKAMDKDGDGVITMEEVEECGVVGFLSSVPSAEEFITGLDTDADGRVTFLEFLEGSRSLFGQEIGDTDLRDFDDMDDTTEEEVFEVAAATAEQRKRKRDRVWAWLRQLKAKKKMEGKATAVLAAEEVEVESDLGEEPSTTVASASAAAAVAADAARGPVSTTTSPVESLAEGFTALLAALESHAVFASSSLSSSASLSSSSALLAQDAKASAVTLRFTAMLSTVGEWEQRLVTNNEDDGDATLVGGGGGGLASIKNPRLRTVLGGVLVGARTPGVVVALRIVYEDFLALRLAGDLIFKLMAAIVGK